MRSRSHSRRSLSHGLWLAALVAAACGSSASEPISLAPGPTEILVGESLTFAPAHLTVTVGTTVHWRNEGPFDHTVTSGASSRSADRPGAEFDSKLPSGGSFDFTFNTVGDHPFFCRPHEGMGMKGIVTVTAPGAADAGASGDGGVALDAVTSDGYPYGN